MGVKKYLSFLNEEVSEEVLKFRRAMGDYGDDEIEFKDSRKFQENGNPFQDDGDDDEDYDNWDTFKREKIFYLFHATEQNLLPTIIRNGLIGRIYLTDNPETALEKHPVLLRIEVNNLGLTKEGDYYIANNIAPNRIEVIGSMQEFINYYSN
jgi:hypothetical protein